MSDFQLPERTHELELRIAAVTGVSFGDMVRYTKQFGSDADEEGDDMPEVMTMSYINLISAYVLIGAFALAVPLTIAYLVVLQMLFHCMRNRHPDDYKRLGEPSVFMNSSISKGMDVVRFLIDRDYLDIPDQRANQLGARSRQLFVAAMSLFGVSLVAFVVTSATF